jgi:HEAT repeat protein
LATWRKQIHCAVPQLIEIAARDQDIFVQRAAIKALGPLRDGRALPALKTMSCAENHFLWPALRESIEAIETSEGGCS